MPVAVYNKVLKLSKSSIAERANARENLVLALLLLFVIGAWGGNYVITKIAVRTNGPWAFNAFRYTTAASLLAAVIVSIQALADRCGLSIGMLSQVERGLSTPSIRSLRLLSIALDVPVSRFFAQSGEDVPVGSPYIIRKAARRSLRLTPTGVRKDSPIPVGDGALEL